MLAQIQEPALAEELAARFELIQGLEGQKSDQLGRLQETGNQFWEIKEFQKMPGIGPVGAHIFSAYIQNPHRFQRREQLIRFCALGVCSYSSDGRKWRNEHLDKRGHGGLEIGQGR